MTASRAGRPRPSVRFLRTFLVALAGILLVAVFGTAALGILGFGMDYGAPRPTPATLRGFELSYRVGDGPPTVLQVDDEGKACDALAASRYLRDSCVLAVNVDPAWIAAPAYGTLNSVDTPSYVAITWRAVMAGDPEQCSKGGLLDGRLENCRAAAAAEQATVTDGTITVNVVRQ